MLTFTLMYFEYPDEHTLIPFDLNADIEPGVGLGGISFNNTISDFKEALMLKNHLKDYPDYFDYNINPRTFNLEISTKQKEITIEISLFTGRITSISCGKGYKGKLKNSLGIGSSILQMMATDKSFGFNLDHDLFNRTPFDGLILGPPNHIRDKFVDAACGHGEYPDFEIDKIILMEMSYAKQVYSHGTMTF